MNMKRIKQLILILSALLVTVPNQLQAQKNINDVIKVNPSNIRVIKDNQDVKGYFIFYKADKLKGKEYSYKLVILDENAEKVATKSLVASKYFALLESSYNQEQLCFKFYDIKEKMVSLIFYDNEANKVKTKKYEARKIEKKMILMNLNSETQMPPTIKSVGQIGFLEYRTVKNEKDGYILTYFPNDKSTKGWTFKSKINSDKTQNLTPLSANEELITSLLVTRPSRMSKDFTYYVIGNDINSGDEQFRYPVKSSKYDESPINAFYNKETGNISLLGYYFTKGDGMTKGKSLGIVHTEIDPKGKELSKDYINWKADVSKVLPVDKRNKFIDVGYLFFHEFIKTTDGRIYGIGESYRKAQKGLNTALKLAAAAGGDASGVSIVTISVEDFYIFEFDSEFNFIDVKLFEKGASNTNIPGLGAAPVLLGYLTKAFNGFDFADVKTIDGGDSFVLFYQDFERRKKEKNKSVAGVISNTKGEYTTDKIDIDTDADFIKVLPAQGSNVLFVEFFKKEKDLQMNMKKLNY